MPVIQPSLFVPPELAVRVASGELGIRGSIVFSKVTGKIVAHLKEISAPKAGEAVQAVPGLFARGIAWGKNLFTAHPVIATVSAVVIVVSSIGAGAYYLSKRKQRKLEKEIQLKAEAFHTSLIQYVKKALDGQIDVGDISNLRAKINSLQTLNSGDKIVIDFESGELATLIKCIVDYTKQLAVVNSIRIDESAFDNCDNIIALDNSLMYQGKILQQAI